MLGQHCPSRDKVKLATCHINSILRVDCLYSEETIRSSVAEKSDHVVKLPAPIGDMDILG